MKRLVAAFLLLSGLLMAGGANAVPLNWTLTSSFSGGISVSGTYTYDADTNTYSNINITYVSGATTYPITTATTVRIANQLIASITNYNTGSPAVLLTLNTAMTNSGGTIQAGQLQVGTCYNSDCNPFNASSTANSFSVSGAAPVPTVTSVSPTSGPETGGTSVTITGTNFTGATAVSFGGTAATGLTVISATLITATSPPGSGTVDVLVTTTGGTSATSSADQFTFLAPVDCVVSSWSAFGACSASCGGGTQTQTRTVITPASNGGAACPALSQSQACNVQACQSQASGTAPGGSGAINATIGSGGSFISTQFTAPTNPPSGQNFPYGVFGFTAATNTLGGSITITLTYPQALAAGTKVFKDINGTWLDYTSNVTFNQSRTTITYSVVDGGPFDSDGVANQSVTDPIGPTIAALSTSSAVPSLSEWTQLLLGLMVMMMIVWQWRKKQS